MEETAKEFHRSTPAETTQTSVPAHHRFCHTRLWMLIRGEIEVGTSDGPVWEELQIILDEFLDILTNYCRNEPSLTERFLTLRVTRSGLITALFMRTPPGAEKKCGHLCARRTGARHLRLRTENYRHGVGAP